MKRLELKIPPPVVALLAGFSMWIIAGYTPLLFVEIPGRKLLCGALVLIGILFDLSGLFAFRKARTTINPLRPGNTTTMIRSGIYRHTRNPMYVGLLIFLSTWALWQANLLACVILPLFVSYMNRYQIIPEERILSSKFGVEYSTYTQSVRRWL